LPACDGIKVAVVQTGERAQLFALKKQRPELPLPCKNLNKLEKQTGVKGHPGFCWKK
jgi:hypothetical protein